MMGEGEGGRRGKRGEVDCKRGEDKRGGKMGGKVKREGVGEREGGKRGWRGGKVRGMNDGGWKGKGGWGRGGGGGGKGTVERKGGRKEGKEGGGRG